MVKTKEHYCYSSIINTLITSSWDTRVPINILEMCLQLDLTSVCRTD